MSGLLGFRVLGVLGARFERIFLRQYSVLQAVAKTDVKARNPVFTVSSSAQRKSLRHGCQAILRICRRKTQLKRRCCLHVDEDLHRLMP